MLRFSQSSVQGDHNQAHSRYTMGRILVVSRQLALANCAGRQLKRQIVSHTGVTYLTNKSHSYD
jgi:hypothetical protein